MTRRRFGWRGSSLAAKANARSTTGADPTMLELELTETQLLADLDAARAVLETVRSMGITVAGVGRDGFDSSAIDAMVSFGLVLGVHVVADGVETAAQLARVRERGCTRAQGHLLGGPSPADEIEALLALGRKSPLVAFLADVADAAAQGMPTRR
jgi:EAL domain-containing protein (putative c-di-GMP-specific phosphodiesterase class I)